jgi:quercetin dioxygenase-like cupin family protein
MDIKHNKATLNRPAGDRVLDAPFVFIDIPDLVEQIIHEKAWEKNDRNGITVYKTDDLTIVVTALQEGVAMEDNEVNGYLTIQVLEGTLRVNADGEERELYENQMMAFHPGVKHSATAVSDTILMITTCNVGEQ